MNLAYFSNFGNLESAVTSSVSDGYQRSAPWTERRPQAQRTERDTKISDTYRGQHQRLVPWTEAGPWHREQKDTQW